MNKKDLVDYFETKDINVTSRNGRVNVLIKNSALIRRKLEEKNTNKEYDIEQFGSLGALIACNNLTSKNADSLDIEIDKGGNSNPSFSYSINNLKQVDKYTKLCVKFVDALKSRDFLNLKKYLSSDITKNLNEQNFQTVLAPLYSSSEILDSKIIAFKIFNNVAGIYTNIYYEDKTAKTFILNFKTNGNDQIVGIEAP